MSLNAEDKKVCKSLGGAHIRGKCDLKGADLSWSDLRNAILKMADLRGADLTGAKVDKKMKDKIRWV